ncbi:hypothetical protein LI165_12265, partial [Phascolarctobacterium faecium]
PAIPSAAIPDPDLAAKQAFQRELEAGRSYVERELQRLRAEGAATAAEQQRLAELERLRRQQEFTGGETEKQRQAAAEAARLEAERRAAE